jgi:hypothetical protein
MPTTIKVRRLARKSDGTTMFAAELTFEGAVTLRSIGDTAEIAAARVANFSVKHNLLESLKSEATLPDGFEINLDDPDF